MKSIFRTILTVTALLFLSCKQEETSYTITVDRDAISDVAASNPGMEALIITTDAPYWIVQAPDWVKPDVIHGVGGGKSTILNLSIASNYKNEATTTRARRGTIKISGGRTSASVSVSQLGHEAYIDPSVSIGGIPSLQEFLDFIEVVNNGEAPVRWMNSNFEVVLLNDIDLSSVTDWTPIGDVHNSGNTNNNTKPKDGEPFTGVFDGGGHTIKNLKQTVTLTDGKSWGLFGYLDHATVKNLNIEAELNLSTQANTDASVTAGTDVGVLAGTVCCSTVENVKVTAKITSTGTTSLRRFAIGGIAGFVFSSYDSAESVSYDSFIKNCVVSAEVSADCGDNAVNTATCAMYGGIAGFCTNIKDDSRIHIENCVNNGSMNVKLGRCSGICPTANYGTIMKGCSNNASQINTIVDGRVGQICCNLSENSAVIDCVNTGNLTTTDSKTTAGALVALIANDTAYIEGGERVANTGTIIGRSSKYLSLLVANTTKVDHVKDIKLAGKLGLYKADGNHEMYPVNASNIMQYIGSIAAACADKYSNITYVGEEAETPSTDGGITDLDLVNDTWN